MTNVAGISTDYSKPIQFTNDFTGRRVSKTVTTWNNSTATKRFVYDGWNLMAELDVSGNALDKSPKPLFPPSCACRFPTRPHLDACCWVESEVANGTPLRNAST